MAERDAPVDLTRRVERLRAGEGTERDRDMARLAFMWEAAAPMMGGWNPSQRTA